MAESFDRLRSALADQNAIERELGSGGTATVYLAEDLKHDRKVAVKVFRPELAAALGTERFFREIKITANFNHHTLDNWIGGIWPAIFGSFVCLVLFLNVSKLTAPPPAEVRDVFFGYGGGETP